MTALANPKIYHIVHVDKLVRRINLRVPANNAMFSVA